MTRVAEMGGAEAEEDGDGAAISTFIFQEIRSVFGTHLSPRDVGARAANQLGRVEVGVDPSLQITTSLATVIRFVAFEADVVRVSVHRVTRGIGMETGA